MSWILITVIAYFLLAVANFGDKFLIDNVLGSSKLYAFLISVLGASVALASPWFLLWPGWFWLIINLATGALFPLALFYMFEALKRGDASRITILIGGIIPFITIGLSYLLFGERFTSLHLSGLILLLLGTFIIAAASKTNANQARSNKLALWFCFLAAVFYGVFFIGTKYAYSHQDFFSSFIWIRLGSLVGALGFLIRRQDRQMIMGSFRAKVKTVASANIVKRSTASPKEAVIKSETAKRWLVLGNQGVGALGSVIQSYAISLGSVAVINALQGVQFVFLLLFGWLLTVWRPRLIKENISRRVVWQKVGAILLVSLGLYFITR